MPGPHLGIMTHLIFFGFVHGLVSRNMTSVVFFRFVALPHLDYFCCRFFFCLIFFLADCMKTSEEILALLRLTFLISRSIVVFSSD